MRKGFGAWWALVVILVAGCDDTIFGKEATGELDVSGQDWCAVQEIFAAECTSCHGATPPNLEGDAAYDNLLNVESSMYAGQVFVIPGDPTGAFLYQKVTATKGDNGGAMPLGAPDGLSEETASVVHDWILAGASRD